MVAIGKYTYYDVTQKHSLQINVSASSHELLVSLHSTRVAESLRRLNVPRKLPVAFRMQLQGAAIARV